MQSFQVMTIESPPPSIRSRTVECGSPSREKRVRHRQRGVGVGGEEVLLDRVLQPASHGFVVAVERRPVAGQLTLDEERVAAAGRAPEDAPVARGAWRWSPPSVLRRMKEFSPVIRTLVGSTGGKSVSLRIRAI